LRTTSVTDHPSTVLTTDYPVNSFVSPKETAIALNLLVLGVSCFDGMASSMRVRNLIEPLAEKQLAEVNNLIYDTQTDRFRSSKGGTENGINFKVLKLVPGNIFSIISFLWSGLRFIKKKKSKQKKNIIYNYDYPDAKNIVFLLFAKWIGYKIVVDVVEDNRFITKYSSFFNKVRMVTSKSILNFSPYFTSAYVGISKHLCNKMQAVGKGKIPVYLIPVTVNFKYFNKTLPRFNQEEVKIFYGGSFGPKDGLPFLLKAFDQVAGVYPNLSLVLSGKGLQSDMDEIFSLISTLNNKNRIIYKGYLDTEEYYKLLTGCEFFCMTRVNSKYANAGFPFKLGEFLATGKPVIATSVGDVPDYLRHQDNALLIEPESVAQLADAISYLLENPGSWQSLGISGRKTAEKYFGSEKLSSQLLDLLQKA
jgi:glycosyltransferase involved in cell wall biosynthesis